jgi:hypothetical protein
MVCVNFKLAIASSETQWSRLISVSLVDVISIGNQMAKHRSAVSDFCQVQKVRAACNTGGGSLNTSQRFLYSPHATPRHTLIATSAQLHDMWAMRTSAGSVASRWYANVAVGDEGKRQRSASEAIVE